MSFVRNINRLLEKYLNIKFIKVFKVKSIISENNKGKNLIVEFLGPPGSGKTYLCNYFVKNYNNSFAAQIITRVDLEAQNIGQIKFSREYNQLLDLRINEISSTSKSGEEKYNSIKHEYQLLKNDIICNNFLSNKLIVADEQIFKTFGKYIFEVIDSESMKSLIKNRIFILCHASPERIEMNQLRKLKPLPYSKEDLLARIAEDFELIEKIRKYGGKVLEINTENNLDFNSKKIYSFIQQSIKHL